jgi:hypothetical protein
MTICNEGDVRGADCHGASASSRAIRAAFAAVKTNIRFTYTLAFQL